SPSAPSAASDASTVAVMVFVTEPTSNRASAGRSGGLAATPVAAASTAAAAAATPSALNQPPSTSASAWAACSAHVIVGPLSSWVPCSCLVWEQRLLPFSFRWCGDRPARARVREHPVDRGERRMPARVLALRDNQPGGDLGNAHALLPHGQGGGGHLVVEDP